MLRDHTSRPSSALTAYRCPDQSGKYTMPLTTAARADTSPPVVNVHFVLRLFTLSAVSSLFSAPETLAVLLRFWPNIGHSAPGAATVAASRATARRTLVQRRRHRGRCCCLPVATLCLFRMFALADRRVECLGTVDVSSLRRSCGRWTVSAVLAAAAGLPVRIAPASCVARKN